MTVGVYSPFTFDVRACVKKGFKRSGTKSTPLHKQAYQKIYTDIMLTNDASLAGVTTGSPADKATHVLVHENIWLNNNPVCLVPESATLISQILKSRFEGLLDTLVPPWPMFSVVIPKETTFGGVYFKGIFVSVSTHQQRQSYIDEYVKSYDISTKLHPPVNQGTLLLINFKTVGKLALDCLLVDLAQIPALLATLAMSKRNTDITKYELLRFVVGFLVYMTAFDNVVEDTGFLAMPQSGKHYNRKLSARQVRNVSTSKQTRFHFRNLRHPCFYNGKFKDRPRGSVWIAVNGAVKTVGSNEQK